MPSVSRSIFTDTLIASAAITAHQAVTAAGAVATTNAIGFATTDAASGEAFAADMLGTSIGIAGAEIDLGERLEVGTAGKLVPVDAGIAVAVARQAAGADGDLLEVFIIPN